MRADLETLLEQRLGVEKELAEAKARVDENEHAIRKLEQERNEKQARQNALREALMQNRLKSEGATVKREALVAQLTEANFELEAVISQLPDSLTEAECEQALKNWAIAYSAWARLIWLRLTNTRRNLNGKSIWTNRMKI